MSFTEIIENIKTTLNPQKILQSLEKAADFYNEPESEQDSTSEDKSRGNLDESLEGLLKSSDEAVKSTETVVKSTAIPNVVPKGAKSLIKLINVWKIYQMGEVEFAALKGINLEIYEGEFVIVLGPSGSGKSTLMNLLGCLDLPSKGTVFLEGRDISTLEESELAKIRGQMIGFIFQSFNLLPTLNTIENVLLPLEFQETNLGEAKKRAEDLLGIVGLSEKKKNLPSQLSGGQRQRVAIARSLAVNPPVILADEPTGNLDSKTGYFILDFLSDLHKKEKKTIIIVTHDVELVKYATRVVYIRDGNIEKIEDRTLKNEVEDIK